MGVKREIGGYFELEMTPDNKEYHPYAIKLNSGRYCLQYIIRAKKYKKIYIPSYICDSVMQPIKNENITFDFYSINEDFEPIFNKQINDNECFLYVNYFGINARIVNKIILKYQNVIIDNTQAFFELPSKTNDTFYSARKFFGVPDGAYLYSDVKLNTPILRGISSDRMNFLLERIETSARNGYPLFQKNELYLDSCGLERMSKITMRLLKNIDYETCRNIRNRNFLFLHKKLSKFNELVIDPSSINGPMVYPFMNSASNLKENLINNNVYVATYWNEVKNRVKECSFENKLVNYLIPLPIDQRYNINDMNYIIKIIRSVEADE